MTKRNYRPDRAWDSWTTATGSRRMKYETIITLIKQIFCARNSFHYVGAGRREALIESIY